MDVHLVFGHLLLDLCFFLWRLGLNCIFLLGYLMVFDLRILCCLLGHSLVRLLRSFYYDGSLRLDSFFHHRINNEICLLGCRGIFLILLMGLLRVFGLGYDDGILLLRLNDGGRWRKGRLETIFLKCYIYMGIFYFFFEGS